MTIRMEPWHTPTFSPTSPPPNGQPDGAMTDLNDHRRAQLAWSHRPGEIASIVVDGL